VLSVFDLQPPPSALATRLSVEGLGQQVWQERWNESIPALVFGLLSTEMRTILHWILMGFVSSLLSLRPPHLAADGWGR
jgi:hypothetical protein